MARGWESKSVEEQQSSEARPEPRVTLEEDPAVRSKRESLVLSRKRVVRDLEGTESDVRKKNLSDALAHLDAELKKLAP